MKKLYYILDPMCSWCYAFAPTFGKLVNSLENNIKIVYVMGGLAPHSEELMPEDMQSMLQSVWKKIELDVGTQFNFNFWTKCKPRRSTYLACQACIAARKQNKEEQMIKAIQEQYYQKAANPSDKSTLEIAAKNIKLNMKKFSEDLESLETIKIFEEDLNLRRSLHVNGFPSLILENDEKYFPITIHFKNHEIILKQIEMYLKN